MITTPCSIWTRIWSCFALTLALTFTSQHAMAQDMAKEIKARGVLRVGAAQAEPWFYKDPATSVWSGVGASLGKSLADALGVKLELVEVTWGTAIAAIQSNKIDMMPILDSTPERKMAVDFPEVPVLYFAQAILMRDGLNATTWEDLNKPSVSIAVTRGSTPESALKQLAPNANIMSFPSNAETVAAFQAGRADACTMFHPPLVLLQQKIGAGKIVLPKPIEYGQTSIAVRKGTDKPFMDFLDAQIRKNYESNQTQLWYEEFLKSRGIDSTKLPPIRKEKWL